MGAVGKKQLRRMAFTNWSASIQPLWGSKSGYMARATAATNALDHQADIAKVQEWLGHRNRDHPALRSPQDAAGG